MIDHWRAAVIQVGSGTYLAAATWAHSVDATLKAALGLTMIVLAWHQILALRKRKNHIDRLEELLRQAKIRCERAANGMCWMQEEAEREREKGAKV